MCPTCLCTGMAMASEHDPRIDPFDSSLTYDQVSICTIECRSCL
ncbi:hypothetical protein Leryth_008311 [Lithospermum erythrorhizon]|nr:hypothetical protein Leryth_008311 [Lithospermum erythrorhizon]